MTVIRDELFFAPGVRMRDLAFDNPESVLQAFEARVGGLFLAPICVLENFSPSEDGALFSASLLTAALIESLARLETNSTKQGTLIQVWLEEHLPEFREKVVIRGVGLSLANVFEFRFRNGLAHNGYVASLGRLSRDIEASVLVQGDIVTVNPFRLARDVAVWHAQYSAELRSGQRDIKRFVWHVEEQFKEEVERAREEAGH